MSTDGGSRKLDVFAALFAALAVSNLLKPLQLSGETGFVLFGERLSGRANAIAGPLFGVYLLVYAWAIWRRRRMSIPMGQVYAAYVLVNLVLFNLRTESPETLGYMLFGVVYTLVAVGVSAGAVYLLTSCRDQLG
ncbi:MAG: hypothetical protein ACE5D3_03020 [Candidatus Binatia bacterium]